MPPNAIKPPTLTRRHVLLRTAGASALATAAWTLGCQTASPAAPASAGAATTTRPTGRLNGTRYESTPWSFSTSSYVIEGPTGLILIDTQFLTSEANAFVDAAEAQTGKPVELAIVLHANPDKFNGTAALQARGIRVVTSAQVAALIPEIHRKRVKAFAPRYAPDYPVTLTVPSVFGASTTVLEAGGTTVTAHVMGAGCSESHVVVTHDHAGARHLYAGDLVANGAHAWLEIGRSDAWLERIDEMKALAPSQVHPGRGPSSDGALLDTQARYLRAVRDIVAGVVEEGAPNATSVAIERITTAYPTLKFPVFLRIGIPAEIARARGPR